MKKKYDLARVNYVTVDNLEYLVPFDYQICPDSKLETSVRELFEEVANVTMYTRAMSSAGVDQKVLPFSGVSKDIVKKALDLLKEIQNMIKKDQ